MPLPLKTTIDLPELSNAQVVALFRVLDDSGRVQLAGIKLADVEDLLHKRATRDDFAWTPEELAAAYAEVGQWFTDAVGTTGTSPLVR